MKRRFSFVVLGLLLGLTLIGGLYVLPGVSAQTATRTPTTTASPDATETETLDLTETPEATTTVTGTGTLAATPSATRTPSGTTDVPSGLGVACTCAGQTITVVGEGTVSVEPDKADVIIGVETMGDNVRDAVDEAGETMEALLEAFDDEGIDEADIQTSGYNVWSDFSPRDGVGVSEPTFRVNNTVRVTVRDLDSISAVLDAAFEAGANSVQGITFTVEDRGDLESRARSEAVSDARARGEELAELVGVNLSGVISVSEVVGNNIFPALRDQALGMGGGGAGPVSPGSLSYSVQLQVVYAIE